MKIGIIKETKVPVDNRVALIPEQVAYLNEQYPNHRIVVQSSDVRAIQTMSIVRKEFKSLMI